MAMTGRKTIRHCRHQTQAPAVPRPAVDISLLRVSHLPVSLPRVNLPQTGRAAA
jgi:hypothetical protein